MIKDGRISNNSSTGSAASGAQIFFNTRYNSGVVNQASSNQPLRIFLITKADTCQHPGFLNRKIDVVGKIANYTRAGR